MRWIYGLLWPLGFGVDLKSSPFDNFEESLLHTLINLVLSVGCYDLLKGEHSRSILIANLAGNVFGPMHNFGLCNLVEFVEADDSSLCSSYVVVCSNQKAMYSLIYIFTHIACHGEGCAI